MMTLMPVAAFAAPADPADFSVTASVFATEKKDAEISKAIIAGDNNTNGFSRGEVDTKASDNAKLVLTYNAANGGALGKAVTTNTYVWVEATGNEPSDCLLYTSLRWPFCHKRLHLSITSAPSGKSIPHLCPPVPPYLSLIHI